tara:strand:- start:598 stop:768 length:171 start_codon:yes stop_codon:yes gene_type:complete
MVSFVPILKQRFLINVVLPEPRSPLKKIVLDFILLKIKSEALSISLKEYEKVMIYI